MAQLQSLAPLIQAQAVLRLSAPALAALPHAVCLLSDFLDVSPRFSLVAAASSGSVLLLKRVAARHANDTQLSPALLSHWFTQALQAAIEKDDLAMVQQIHLLHPEPLVVYSLEFAMRYGTLELVQWLVQHRHDRLCCAPGLENLCKQCLFKALPALGKQDVFRVVQWLLDEGVELSSANDGFMNTPLHSAMLQSVEFVRWCDERGILSDKVVRRLWNSVISNERVEALDVAQYLVASGRALSQDELIPVLIRGSCQRQKEAVIDLVWSSHLCDSIRGDAVYAATRVGGDKVLQWSQAFLDQHDSFGAMAFYAAHFVHLDSIAWLFEARGVRPPEVPTRKPASEQDLLLFYRWRKANALDVWTPDEMDAAAHEMDVAARHGYLEAVQWLHASNSAGCTANAMDLAALSGHLAVVKWLHENRTEGCTSAAANYAASRGHVEVVQWLLTHRTEHITTEVMASAVRHGRVDVAQWLFDNQSDACLSCVANTVINFATGNDGALSGLRWLHDHGATTTACSPVRCYTPTSPPRALALYAATDGDLQLLQFLAEYFPETGTSGDLAVAVALARDAGYGGHEPVVQWINERTVDTSA